MVDNIPEAAGRVQYRKCHDGDEDGISTSHVIETTCDGHQAILRLWAPPQGELAVATTAVTTAIVRAAGRATGYTVRVRVSWTT